MPVEDYRLDVHRAWRLAVMQTSRVEACKSVGCDKPERAVSVSNRVWPADSEWKSRQTICRIVGLAGNRAERARTRQVVAGDSQHGCPRGYPEIPTQILQGGGHSGRQMRIVLERRESPVREPTQPERGSDPD